MVRGWVEVGGGIWGLVAVDWVRGVWWATLSTTEVTRGAVRSRRIALHGVRAVPGLVVYSGR